MRTNTYSHPHRLDYSHTRMQDKRYTNLYPLHIRLWSTRYLQNTGNFTYTIQNAKKSDSHGRHQDSCCWRERAHECVLRSADDDCNCGLKVTSFSSSRAACVCSWLCTMCVRQAMRHGAQASQVLHFRISYQCLCFAFHWTAR